MIYRNASVSIRGHILVQKVEIINEKYLKFAVTADGLSVNLLISDHPENDDLIKAIIRHTNKKYNDHVWDFKCLINIVDSEKNDVKYTNYCFFVEDGVYAEDQTIEKSAERRIKLSKKVEEITTSLQDL